MGYDNMRCLKTSCKMKNSCGEHLIAYKNVDNRGICKICNDVNQCISSTKYTIYYCKYFELNLGIIL
jgi:hypothetical protein